MQCSVVIPCHNGAALTAACIESLLQQAGSHDLEILLVDNASTDDTAALATLSPRVRVLRQPRNLGFAGGVNAGIRAAVLPHLLILNNDTQAATNLLAELHAVLESDPRIGAVAPVSNHVKGPARLPVGALGKDAAARAELADALADSPPIQDLETLAGLCLLLRRETIDRVGFFDERFGHGNFEDDDYCLRLRLGGHRLALARRAFLHHEGHATFRALGLDIGDELRRRGAQFAAKWQHDPAGRAVLLAMRGDVAAAADAALAARGRWPQWADADWHLALGAERRGDLATALEHLRRLLAANPRHSAAAVKRIELLLDGDREDEARACLDWATTHCHLDSDQARGLFESLGRHAHRRGRWTAALEHFRAARSQAPANGLLHNWIGVCELAIDDIDAAMRSFTSAIEHGCALGHTNLGICHHRRGDAGTAARHFAAAFASLPEDRAVAANHAAMQQAMQPCAPPGRA